MPGNLRFQVLGLIRAWRDEVELDLGPRQRQLILALLLVADGRPVDLAEFVTLLWGDDPPPSAVNVVHRYIGGLRGLLEPELPNRASGQWLQRHGAGYRLDTAGASLDLRQARTLAASARQLAAPAAVAVYVRALDLWDGRCGAGLDGAAGVHPAFVAVDREASALARAAADAALDAGLSPAVLPALRRAAERDSFDEALQARLLLCLAADGRQAEALTGYQSVRGRLAEELGIEPGPDLLQAHRRILEQQLTPHQPLAAPQAQPPTDLPGFAPAEPLPVPPAQLPTDLPGFTGRRSELAQLDALLSAGTAVAVIDGMPGVGKSTLATHWAHRAADRFPDGQLFLDLRGFDADGTPTTPLDALGSLLTGLGMSPARLPAGLDARAGLYRSLLAGRRILVVLDNALNAAQVTPLLPAAPGCATVITSRHRLTELTQRGARALTADLPGLDDARASLRARIGDQRAAAEPEALDEIIARCGRLPLALAVVGARAHTNPGFSLAAIAAELNPLDALHDIFSWSYRSLSQPAARLLRLLSLHVGGEITIAAAASLAGLPPRQARELTGELAAGRLLVERQPGRYVLHDLIHAYAAELARDHEPPAERDAALARLLTHYALTAQHARDWLGTPSSLRPPETPSAGEVTAEPIASYDAAVRTLARISSIVAARIRDSSA